MIPRRSMQYLNCLPLLVLLPCSVVRGASETTNVEYYNAIVNVTAQEPGSKSVLDGGRYGLDSPVTEAKGIIVTPVNILGGICFTLFCILGLMLLYSVCWRHVNNGKLCGGLWC